MSEEGIRFNFNYEVTVTLTERGKPIWDAYWSGLPVRTPSWEVGQTRKMQLWFVARVFGDAMCLGFDPPIETTFTLHPPQPTPA